MKERVLVIGGARSQCHAIDILKSLNRTTIVADYDANCMGAAMADYFYQISTADVEALVNVAKIENINAVISVQSDLGMVTASRITDRLGLKGLSPALAELFSNKHTMRLFLEKNGYPTPAYQRCMNDYEIKEFAYRHGFPIVVKPLDSQGSRGVTIIKSPNDFPSYCDCARYNRDYKGVIAEKFLIGSEYTVEGIVIGGKHYSLAVSKKRHYQYLDCVSNQLLYTWDPVYDKLIKMHDSLIEMTRLPFGLTHSEYIETADGFVLVEFAARGGGSMIASHIVPAVSGWDVEEMYIKELLDEEITLPERKYNHAVLEFIEMEEKKISSIQGIEEIKRFKQILHFQLNYQVGDFVCPVENDTSRHGYYIACAETRNDLLHMINKINKTLKIEYC